MSPLRSSQLTVNVIEIDVISIIIMISSHYHMRYSKQLPAIVLLKQFLMHICQ